MGRAGSEVSTKERRALHCSSLGTVSAFVQRVVFLSQGKFEQDFFPLAVPRSLWDLHSPTRTEAGACAPCGVSMKSYSMDWQGSPTIVMVFMFCSGFKFLRTAERD